MKRRFCSMVLLFAILTSILVFASAANDGIMPCYNNTAGTSTNFTISTTGKATITATFDGYRGTTSGATITSYIEKRTLGVFWTKVDIGETNNEWVDTINNYYGLAGHEFQLPSTGTYRATVVYEIRGSGGATDVIDFNKTLTY